MQKSFLFEMQEEHEEQQFRGKNLSSNPILPLKPYSSTVSVCRLTIQTTWLTMRFRSIRIAAFCYSLSAHHALSNNVCVRYDKTITVLQMYCCHSTLELEKFSHGWFCTPFPASHSDVCRTTVYVEDRFQENKQWPAHLLCHSMYMSSDQAFSFTWK